MARILMVLCAALSLTFAPAAQGQTAGWTLSEVTGQVVLTSDGRAAPVQRGTVVLPGATIQTGMGARAVVVRGRDFITLAPNSRVRIPATTEKRGLLEVIQEWGNAIFQIDKQKAPHFGVQTPYLAAVVKGTTFSITVTGEGASLQVVEGAVETSTIDGGAAEIIRPGIVASVSRGDLMRLTVRGQDTHVIDSAQRVAPTSEPTVAPSDSATPVGAVGSAEDVGAASAAATGSKQVAQTFVAAPIFSRPLDLSAATGGLVDRATEAASLTDSSRESPRNTDGGATAPSPRASDDGAARPGPRDTPNANHNGGGVLASQDDSRNSGSGGPGDAGPGGGHGKGDGPGNGNGKPDGPGGANPGAGGGKPGDAAGGADHGSNGGNGSPGKDDGKGNGPGNGNPNGPGGANPGAGGGKPGDAAGGADHGANSGNGNSGKDDAHGNGNGPGGSKGNGSANGSGDGRGGPNAQPGGNFGGKGNGGPGLGKLIGNPGFGRPEFGNTGGNGDGNGRGKH